MKIWTDLNSVSNPTDLALIYNLNGNDDLVIHGWQKQSFTYDCCASHLKCTKDTTESLILQ